MGIKDLNTFLKSKGVDCFKNLPLHLLSNKRVGIDSLNWVFCYVGSCIKSISSHRKDVLEPISQEEIYQKMVSEFINFNIKLLDYNITPVWIWDGVSKDNKLDTKESRKKAREKLIEKKENIFKQLKEMNPLERPYELIEEYKKLLNNSSYMKRDRVDDLKNFGKEIGLPTITSEDEGENLGSSLSVSRILAAFWSSDTDTYPLGCPIVVKGFETIDNELNFKCVFTLEILKKLNFNHDEFRDFCIMLGTDFNERIYKIGPVKSYDLITKHRNIENIEKETNHDCNCLDYKVVRKQLKPYKTNYDGINDLKVDKSIDFESVREKYKKYYNIESLLNSIKYLNDPQNIIKNN